MQTKRITETGIITRGFGELGKITINSHTSGTLALYDALGAGVAATGTLTSSGAMVPASHGQTKLTSNGTNVTAGKVFVLGSKTYTFVASAGADGEVTIGASAAVTLDNVKSAINGTDGINTAHPYFIATTNTDTTQLIVARVIGDDTYTTTVNGLATTTDETTLSWADTTYGGGTGDSNPAVSTAAATFTIGDITYTGTLELSETSGATAVPYQVLWVTSEAVFLDNIKSAINCAGVVGTDYSTGTYEHPKVYATTNTNTAQTVVSKTTGTGGNSIATTETMANYAWGAATLASGTGLNGKLMHNTMTFSAVATTGERVIDLTGESFSTGLYAVVGGTADITVSFK